MHVGDSVALEVQGMGVQPSVRSRVWEVKSVGESVGGGHPDQSKGVAQEGVTSDR